MSASPYLTRICWIMGCSNMAMHQMIELTYKNPTTQENPEGVLNPSLSTATPLSVGLENEGILDRASFHQRTNAYMLCILGLSSLSFEVSKQIHWVPITRRRLPHYLAFTFLTSATLFQSISLYGIVILRDYTHLGSIHDALNLGDAL